MLRKQISVFCALMSLAATQSCKREERFPDLGTKVASPIDVAADKSGSYFFVLNADYSRDYNAGSLLTVSTGGEKINALPLPRLGRSLTIAGDDILVTIASAGEESEASAILIDASNPKSPTIQKTWNLSGCNPINAAMRTSPTGTGTYKYFAVSCIGGAMWHGELKSPRSDSTLVHARNYPSTHRAMIIDTSRNLLIAFPTNVGEQSWTDAAYEDSESAKYIDAPTTEELKAVKETGIPKVIATDIPDTLEQSRVARASLLERGKYQFYVYDLTQTPPENGNLVPKLDGNATQAELRWIYYNLSNFDGTPDVAQTSDNQKTRYYHTNFWTAQPDPDDADSFYLSQRGLNDAKRSSPYANNVIRASIIGDLTKLEDNAQYPESIKHPLKTEAVMSFERVYGFKGELNPNGLHYPGSFQVGRVQGSLMLLVNHFRDLVNFPRDQAFFSVASKVIGENDWFSELQTTDATRSYYQLALTPSGTAMALSFYGNVLVLLDIKPGQTVKETQIIP